MEYNVSKLEKGREAVRRWYANNREAYSELRRRRYKDNPAIRAKARKAAASYRRARQEGKAKVKRVLVRVYNGKPIEVFTSGYVADRIKYNPQILRSWEERGWLPEPLFKDARHRMYTARQVTLIKLLADTVRPKAGRRARTDGVEDVVALINKTWKVMDDGRKEGQKAGRGSRRS